MEEILPYTGVGTNFMTRLNWRQAGELASELFAEEEVPLQAPFPPLPPSIGGCRIKRLIAIGGMGTVYEAEQEQPRRAVAIKVLRPGIASHSVLRRFEHEAQVLAHLKHPNIAHVYDAGMYDGGTGGVPYFIMEYIPGAQSITDYARARDLTKCDRLEHFLHACDAVQHGHRKGIIHRDLKPANILVDEDGRTKIIDFGIARATDADIALTTLRTDVRELIGTLQYMSPEQCDGDPHEIDVRSDVYSLGMVLYELLTDRLPYDVTGSTITHAARAIRETDPPRLSSIQKSLRGDLETITLKAIAKDPANRYQSAGELAADVRRYLAGEPIEAKPPGRWVKCVRWAGKHPRIVAISVALSAIFVLTPLIVLIVVAVGLSEPISLVRTNDNTKVTLLAKSGRTIKEWTVKRSDARFRFAELLPRPEETGGGHVAVLAVDLGGSQDNYAPLSGFDAKGALDDPDWTREIVFTQLPPSVHNKPTYQGIEFGVSDTLVADFFPEIPGDEIVCAHTCVYSPAAIEIVDLNGNVHYRVWNDGTVGEFLWLPVARLLLIYGLNSEVYWEDRGVNDLEAHHPTVIYALRPTIGHIRDDWVTWSGQEDDPTLAWYHTLLPASETGIFIQTESTGLNLPGAEEDDGRCFRLSFALEALPAAEITWLVDEDGQFLPDKILPNDGFWRGCREFTIEEGVPDLEYVKERYFLGSLPPVVKEHEGQAASN